MARDFLPRLALWRETKPKSPNGTKVGVLITPWQVSAVPMYSLECALKLAHEGFEVSVYWDATNMLGNAADRTEVASIGALIAQLPPHIRVHEIAAIDETLSIEDEGIARAIIKENAIATMKGESRIDDYLTAHPEAYQATQDHLGRIHHILKSTRPAWLFVPGGVWGVSAAYVVISERLGLGISTYDYGRQMVYAHGGVAAHYADVPDAYRLLLASADEAARRRVIDEGYAELAKRRAGTDSFGYQAVAASGSSREKFTLLAPLNLRWDSAALSRQKLFPSVEAWLAALIQWVEREPRARLCIRQHPAERLEDFRSTDDVKGFVEKMSPPGGRVTYVAAEDSINTYDVMDGVSAVLPFTSTVGLEAAMLGKPVIISTHCYYQDFDFAWNPGTVDEYFALIGKALAGELQVSQEARETAAIVLQLTFKYNLVPTFFNPEPSPVDYPKWTSMPPEQLWALPEVEDCLRALTSREPLSFVRFQRLG